MQSWRFDHSTLLIDESRDEFTSYFYPAPTYKYPPNVHGDSYFPEPIYIPKPANSYNYDESTRIGNTYIPPSPNGTNLFSGYPDRRSPPVQVYKYSNDIPPYQGDNSQPGAGLPQVSSPYYKVWNRKEQGRYDKPYLVRKKRDAKINKKIGTPKSYSNQTVVRNKRQSALIGQTLCPTRSQFIMPRAALNNKGNWMYVVNMPEVDSRYSQLVKSETCA